MPIIPIGVLANLAERDREILARIDTFLLGVNQPNVRLIHRFGAGAKVNYDRLAQELVTHNPTPQYILATCWPTTRALRDATGPGTPGNNIKIVFAGLVNQPPAGPPPPAGGSYNYQNNITGIVSHDTNLCAEWVRLLQAVASGSLQRVAVIYDPSNTTMQKQYAAIQTAAPGNGIQANNVVPIDGRWNELALESSIATFAQPVQNPPIAGLIVPTATMMAMNRRVIMDIAARYGLPAMYPNRMYPIEGGLAAHNGGLVSYGPKLIDQYRTVGGFVNSMINGTPIMPVQVNNVFELVINLRAANAINLVVPPAVLAQANLIIDNR
jgi:putative tryptophan/tyrosine transport system substrate-binding protein